MPRVGWLVAIGSLLVAGAAAANVGDGESARATRGAWTVAAGHRVERTVAVGHSDERARGDEAALLATLDRLVALERRDGAWTFAAAPHTRPAPSTMVVKIAERVASPFGLADWDLVVMRSPGTPAAILALVDGYERSGRAAYLDSAKCAGDLLVRTQLPSGGWYSEMPVEGDHLARWFAATVRRTMLDDDVTTGGARALLALWRTTGDVRYRDGAERALGLLVDPASRSTSAPMARASPAPRSDVPATIGSATSAFRRCSHAAATREASRARHGQSRRPAIRVRAQGIRRTDTRVTRPRIRAPSSPVPRCCAPRSHRRRARSAKA